MLSCQSGLALDRFDGKGVFAVCSLRHLKCHVKTNRQSDLAPTETQPPDLL